MDFDRYTFTETIYYFQDAGVTSSVYYCERAAEAQE